MDINYLPLFLILAIAWLVPLFLSWLKVSAVPAVIVEIIMGVLVGPYVLNWVEQIPYMDFLASTGFLVLIFLAGLEIDVNKIVSSFPRHRIRAIDFVSNSLILATLIYIGSLIVALPFAIISDFFIEIDVVFITVLMPTVALSIMVPILKADGELSRKFGQVLLMEGAIATIVSIILISIYSGVLNYGFRFEILLFTVIFVVFIIVYFIGRILIKIHTFQNLLYRLEHAASQIRVRGTIALLLFFVIVAHLINVELVMGAFFAGALLSIFVSKERSALLFKLDGMSYGFFIPIFFIMVGVNLDLSGLYQFRESIPFIITLTAGFFITQIIPALIMARIFGFKKALAGGLLLSVRLGLSIATAQIGLSLGVINTAENAGIVTASILASLISPMSYKLINRKKEPFHHILLLGGSRASLFLSERFKMHNIPCLTYLQNMDIIPEFERKSLNFRKVDKLNSRIFKHIELHTGDIVILLTESKKLNRELTLYIKKELQHNKIITSQHSEFVDQLEPHNETRLMDQDEVLAHHVEDLIIRPDAMASLSVSFDLYGVSEIRITNKKIHRKFVRDVAFPLSGSLVIVRRGDEIFIPHGNTHLLFGDVITVIGNRSALSDFRKILQG
jgi:Kef-type K+ transport system membrane component KefB/Trk K+ transport system NAD-binding subunit